MNLIYLFGHFMFSKLDSINEGTIPSRYSINLMWINRTLNPDKPYISQDDSEEHFIKNVLNKVSLWKKSNPDAEVSLWYDRNFVTDEALERTKVVLENMAKQDNSFKFNLKDIRQIDFVRQNRDALSDYLPIYYRVDLLKLIICVNSLESDQMDAAIFADLEIGDQRINKDRMSKEELFNPEIMERLNILGLQVNKSGSTDENQFFQILNKKGAICAIKTYINVCMARAITALNCTDENLREDYLLPQLSCAVFDLMSRQLFPLIEMVAYNKEVLVQAALFESNPTTKWIKYDIEKHGYLPLGHYYDDISYHICHKRGVLFSSDSGVNTNYNNLIPYYELIKFEFFSSKFSRDMQTRFGKAHYEIRKNLVKRNPANGSQTYTFLPWSVSNSLDKRLAEDKSLNEDKRLNEDKSFTDLLIHCGHFKENKKIPAVIASYPLEQSSQKSK